MTILLEGSRAAATTFNVAGATPPRPKGIFYACFRGVPTANAQSPWSRNLGFLVKSVEQPSIQPKTESLNQYNKQRKVYTSYAIQPIRMTFYDTTDGMAMQMWAQYVNYFFADFGHTVDDYAYDAVNFDNQMLNSAQGYGFLPQNSSDVNSQFFFSELDIYQVDRASFTKTTLVNPRFESFNPDELAYDSMETVTISTVIACEAIIYANNGSPAPISSDPILSEVFLDTRLSGDLPDPGGAQGLIAQTLLGPSGLASIPSLANNLGGIIQSGLGGIFNDAGVQNIGQVAQSGTGGVLSGYGNFNFVSTPSAASSLLNNSFPGSQIGFDADGFDSSNA